MHLCSWLTMLSTTEHAKTYKMYAKYCSYACNLRVGAACSWIVNIITYTQLCSLVSYTPSALVFVHVQHPCLMKLPVSYDHYVQCYATRVKASTRTILPLHF